MSKLSEALISWYGGHSRDLPWRKTYDPYAIWVSEVMLQQTRVDTVIPYYERFMGAFPNIHALAHAEEESYLKHWEGLGYYLRVRNLVKGVRYVEEHYGGTLPENMADLLRIPGIGPYTARAILSIAFGEKEVAVDGNLIRVFARLTASKIVPNEESAKRACEDYFKKHINYLDAGSFNQALMDLGELVCVPNGAPACSSCPLAGFCKAHQEKNEQAYPLPKKKIEKKTEHRLVLLVIHDNKIWIVKRPDQGLLGGMYEFPNAIIKGKDKIAKIVQKFDISCKNPVFLMRRTHIFTHLKWEMDAYVVKLDGLPSYGLLASPIEIKQRFTMPNAFSPFLDALLEEGYLQLSL